MNEKELKQVEELINKTLKRELPKILGRSLPQIKEYLIKNIV